MADRAEVVDLVGVSGFDGSDQRGRIGEITLNEVQERKLALKRLLLGVLLAPDEAVDLIALLAEELREVPAILTRNPCHERTPFT